jgi:hypothetical protein
MMSLAAETVGETSLKIIVTSTDLRQRVPWLEKAELQNSNFMLLFGGELILIDYVPLRHMGIVYVTMRQKIICIMAKKRPPWPTQLLDAKQIPQDGPSQHTKGTND